ncbi:triacylglycerol lipase [Variovorax sp. YR216]|uniref:esterase/lipase family protein n=1 Tax=Variovorax sp. YR216 TaxID=1882828 RepID=UPI00089994D8|nr:alpha/beta fold hydrolase [Variovorax sp. YR216]SEA01519.1 PGAP1-like protein [Variovorax sp. YR216]
MPDAEAPLRVRWLAMLVLCALAAGCSLLQADRQMRRLDNSMYFTGIVETEKEARGPIVVVLYEVDATPTPVFLEVVPRSRGVYHLAGAPAKYRILAFEDINGDMTRQPGEPGVDYEGTALSIDAVNDPPTAATGLGHIRIPSSAPAGALPVFPAEAYAALVQRRRQEFGSEASISEKRFSPPLIREGMFQPFRFLEEGRSGLFMLEPYDPQRVPVIFVHGIGGSPRDWEHVIEKLDRTRFQPWVFYYPSGFSIGLSAMMLNNAVDELHFRHGFPTSIVVAHSMGGLVARGALNIILREGREPPVHHVITISTPWLGQEGARWADIGPTRVPASWLDMAPGSAYLSELTVVRRPPDIRYTLFFGYGGRSSFASGNNDGVVSMRSMLPPELQSRANFIFGFDEDHTSILASDAMIDVLQARMKDELGHWSGSR